MKARRRFVALEHVSSHTEGIFVPKIIVAVAGIAMLSQRVVEDEAVTLNEEDA
jgi:hypothetical protein